MFPLVTSVSDDVSVSELYFFMNDDQTGRSFIAEVNEPVLTL